METDSVIFGTFKTLRARSSVLCHLQISVYYKFIEMATFALTRALLNVTRWVVNIFFKKK